MFVAPPLKLSIQTNFFPFMSFQVFYGGSEFFASPLSVLAGRILSTFSSHLAETQGDQFISRLVTVRRTDLTAFNTINWSHCTRTCNSISSNPHHTWLLHSAINKALMQTPTLTTELQLNMCKVVFSVSVRICTSQIYLRERRTCQASKPQLSFLNESSLWLYI
jgi:hypothetical protein